MICVFSLENLMLFYPKLDIVLRIYREAVRQCMRHQSVPDLSRHLAKWREAKSEELVQS